VGVAGGFYAERLDAAVSGALAEAVAALRELGAAVEPVAVPDRVDVEACSNVPMCARRARRSTRASSGAPGELHPGARRLTPA